MKTRSVLGWRMSVCALVQFILFVPCQAFAQSIIFADDSATGANDGSSWCDAYVYLQDALAVAAASNGSITEIRVAQGIYTPDQGGGQIPGDRKASFGLQSGVALRGSYAGCGAVDPNARDPGVFETILSGDLNGNDDPAWVPESSCCFATGLPGCDDEACEHMVVSLIMECGDAWESFCVTSAQFMCCDLCRTTFCDNSYHVLTASDTDSTAVLDGFVVTAGEANAFPDEEDSTLAYGAGIYGHDGSPTLVNCTFAVNVAYGGAGMYFRYGSPKITDCDVSDNLFGGGYSIYGDPTLVNCTFTRNAGSGMRIAWGDDPVVSYCTFVENEGRGLSYDGTGSITGCRFIGNAGGGLVITDGAPNVIDCDFIGNDGTDGGGMFNGGFSQVINSRFFGNSVSGDGGGLGSTGGLILLNCIFSGNSADFGGGLVHGLGSALVLGCTFFGNSARDVGGMWNGGITTIANSIFWNNQSDCCVSHGVANDSQHPPYVDYSCMQGGVPPVWGVGNVSYEPLFVDADGPDNILGTEDDDFRLSVDSPLINAGDPDPPLVPYTDHDGHERILCGRLDMGAFEFGIGDYDCNMFVELIDFAAWDACMTGPDSGPFDAGCEAFDFDADVIGDIDLKDFAGFQLTLRAK